MINRYAISRKDIETRAGWTFCYHMVIAPAQIHKKAYISDIGLPDRDRISLYIEDDTLILECIDASMYSHKFTCAYKANERLFLRFEFATDEPGILVSVNINNEEVDLRIGRKRLQISPDINSFFFGSDLQGSRGTCFKLLETYVVNKTLNIEDRLGTFHYFKSKVSSEQCLEFNGTSFIFRNKDDGNLIQTENDKGPILRNSAFYPVP